MQCSRQISIVCQFLQELKLDHEDILVAQGKAFLEVAFIKSVYTETSLSSCAKRHTRRYGHIGLFFSLLKRDNLPEGFFSAIQHVMKHLTKLRLGVSIEGENMKDTVVRDTLNKLLEAPTNTTILCSRNLLKFIDQVHHQNYPESLMIRKSTPIPSVL